MEVQAGGIAVRAAAWADGRLLVVATDNGAARTHGITSSLHLGRTSDVQTVALVSSQVVLPRECMRERAACSEWLEAYWDLLNTRQMWQSRAMFDVGGTELLQRLLLREHQPPPRLLSSSLSSSVWGLSRRSGPLLLSTTKTTARSVGGP